MKRVSIVLSATLAIGGQSFFATRVLRSYNPAPNPTFTVVQHEQFTGYQPAVSSQRQLFYARRRDGTSVEGNIKERPNKPTSVVRSISFPSDKKYVVVTDAIASMSTYFLSPEAAARRKSGSPDPTCAIKFIAGQQLLMKGYEKILGYDVVKLEYNGRLMRLEIWEAPALGCYGLYSVTDQKNADGSPNSRTEITTVSVTVGEPAELFNIPANYTEEPPSLATQKLTNLYIGFLPNSLHDAIERGDKGYYESQKYAPPK